MCCRYRILFALCDKYSYIIFFPPLTPFLHPLSMSFHLSWLRTMFVCCVSASEAFTWKFQNGNENRREIKYYQGSISNTSHTCEWIAFQLFSLSFAQQYMGIETPSTKWKMCVWIIFLPYDFLFICLALKDHIEIKSHENNFSLGFRLFVTLWRDKGPKYVNAKSFREFRLMKNARAEY